MERERDDAAEQVAVVTSQLEAERKAHADERHRHGATHRMLTNALHTIDRLRNARDRYRDLVRAIDAALRGVVGTRRRRLPGLSCPAGPTPAGHPSAAGAKAKPLDWPVSRSVTRLTRSIRRVSRRGARGIGVVSPVHPRGPTVDACTIACESRQAVFCPPRSTTNPTSRKADRMVAVHSWGI